MQNLSCLPRMSVQLPFLVHTVVKVVVGNYADETFLIRCFCKWLFSAGCPFQSMQERLPHPNPRSCVRSMTIPRARARDVPPIPIWRVRYCPPLPREVPRVSARHVPPIPPLPAIPHVNYYPRCQFRLRQPIKAGCWFGVWAPGRLALGALQHRKQPLGVPSNCTKHDPHFENPLVNWWLFDSTEIAPRFSTSRLQGINPWFGTVGNEGSIF